MATSFSGGRSRSTRREPPTMGKQLVNFITWGCDSNAPFFCKLQSRVRTHAVLVIGLYEWLGNPTIIEPPGPFKIISERDFKQWIYRVTVQNCSIMNSLTYQQFVIINEQLKYYRL